MKVKAIRFKQSDVTLYFFVVKIDFIYNSFEVSKKAKNKQEGYQRSFSKTRINSIANYIKKKGIIPNSVLVGLDKGVASFNENTNDLTFKKIDNLGWIIDGQHRVKGVYDGNKNFLMPIIATEGLDEINQARLFVKINSTQKGVPVSLYLDLLDTIDGVIEDFDDENVPVERRATEIVKRLNTDENSPFYDLIRTTGEYGKGISLSEFVRQLKVYVHPKTGKLMMYGFEQQYKIFNIYFKAIKSVFLEQWEEKNSILLKTVGFGGLMIAFNDIFNLILAKYAKFSTKNSIELLKIIKDFNFKENAPLGGGLKAQKAMGEKFELTLKKAIKNEDSDFKVPEIED